MVSRLRITTRLLRLYHSIQVNTDHINNLPPMGQQSQYPPQQQGGYPPNQQYGAAPGQQGRPQQGLSQQAGAYKQLLQTCIQENHLENMYRPNDPRLDMYAQKAMNGVDQLTVRWRVPREVAQDVVKLALYDIILYIDNSGSMASEDGGERIQDLKAILARVACAATLFDDDGIQVRFMNARASHVDPSMLNGIRSEQQAEDLVARVNYTGLTPLGTELRNQVLDPLVLQPARSGQLRKPVLIITITDGQPAGEPKDSLYNAIRHVGLELSRMPQYGKHACVFQFAQVGNDQAARKFLSDLDIKDEVRDVVDCTSNFENEQDEMARLDPPVDLTPDLWQSSCLEQLTVPTTKKTNQDLGVKVYNGHPKGNTELRLKDNTGPQVKASTVLRAKANMAGQDFQASSNSQATRNKQASNQGTGVLINHRKASMESQAKVNTALLATLDSSNNRDIRNKARPRFMGARTLLTPNQARILLSKEDTEPLLRRQDINGS
ncbi:hypothetical protein MMC13_008079 [Lambiella insularis]|nr:hypothetical protein [Lambiella insularis]